MPQGPSYKVSYLICVHIYCPTQCVFLNVCGSLCDRISRWAVVSLKWVEKLLHQCHCQWESCLRLHLSIQNWNVLYQNGLNGEFFSAKALKLTENHEGRVVFRFFGGVGFIFYVCALQAQRWSQSTATSSSLPEWNGLVLKTICSMTATTQVRCPWHLFK